MRRLLTGTTAIIFLGGQAFAADLPTLKGPAYTPPPPVFSWSGVYFGGNVGYAFSDPNNQQTLSNDAATLAQLVGGTVPRNYSMRESGVTTGAQVGANYEFPLSLAGGSGIVVGAETDFAFTGLEKSSLIPTAGGTLNDYHQSLHDLGTIRGRIGFAIDRVLVYATGGLAYGEVGYSHGFLGNAAGNPPLWAGNVGPTMRTGYAVGGGIEYALAAPFVDPGVITIRAEALHYDLGTGTASLPFVPAPGALAAFTDHFHTSGNLVRLGMNYKFDLFEPVSAKY